MNKELNIRVRSLMRDRVLLTTGIRVENRVRLKWGTVWDLTGIRVWERVYWRTVGRVGDSTMEKINE